MVEHPTEEVLIIGSVSELRTFNLMRTFEKPVFHTHHKSGFGVKAAIQELLQLINPGPLGLHTGMLGNPLILIPLRSHGQHSYTPSRPASATSNSFLHTPNQQVGTSIYTGDRRPVMNVYLPSPYYNQRSV